MIPERFYPCMSPNQPPDSCLTQHTHPPPPPPPGSWRTHSGWPRERWIARVDFPPPYCSSPSYAKHNTHSLSAAEQRKGLQSVTIFFRNYRAPRVTFQCVPKQKLFTNSSISLPQKGISFTSNRTAEFTIFYDWPRKTQRSRVLLCCMIAQCK